MSQVAVSERLPEHFRRVWVATDKGHRVTGFIRSDGTWQILCKRVAAENPTITHWED